MDSWETLKIKSDRLILQPIALEFKQDIFQEFTSEITYLMFPKPAENIQETEYFIQTSIQQRHNKTDLALTILRQQTNEFLGICGIHKINTDTPELGIWLKKSAHGNGFGKEAIHSLKNWVDRNLNCQYILYPVEGKNLPSRKIPESFGAKIFRHYQQISASGKTLDLLEYRIFPNN